jgi:hypothetical protein
MNAAGKRQPPQQGEFDEAFDFAIVSRRVV